MGFSRVAPQGIWSTRDGFSRGYLEDHPSNYGDRKSPKWGYSLYKWPYTLLVNGGDPITTYPSPGMILQDPPSSVTFLLAVFFSLGCEGGNQLYLVIFFETGKQKHL